MSKVSDIVGKFVAIAEREAAATKASNSKSPFVLGNAVEECKACKKAVYIADKKVNVGGKVYHHNKDCFKCCTCDVPLDARTFVTAFSRLYCKKHCPWNQTELPPAPIAPFFEKAMDDRSRVSTDSDDEDRTQASYAHSMVSEISDGGISYDSTLRDQVQPQSKVNQGARMVKGNDNGFLKYDNLPITIDALPDHVDDIITVAAFENMEEESYKDGGVYKQPYAEDSPMVLKTGNTEAPAEAIAPAKSAKSHKVCTGDGESRPAHLLLLDGIKHAPGRVKGWSVRAKDAVVRRLSTRPHIDVRAAGPAVRRNAIPFVIGVAASAMIVGEGRSTSSQKRWKEKTGHRTVKYKCSQAFASQLVKQMEQSGMGPLQG